MGNALQIAAMGMACADRLQFEELVKVCEEEGRWAFMVVASPLRLPHGTGSDGDGNLRTKRPHAKAQSSPSPQTKQSRSALPF
jgi:hypothetical protein